MMKKSKKNSTDVLNVESVKILRSISNRFGGEHSFQKEKLLHEFISKTIYDVSVLLAYHECLLFLLAYPENKILLELAGTELERVASIAQSIYAGTNERKKIQLTGTGLVYTPVHVAFGYELTAWLANEYPLQLTLYECAADKEKVKSIVSLFLPDTEREAFEKAKYSLEKFIELSRGKQEGTVLQWLAKFFGEKRIALPMRDHLYDALKIYVSWLTDASSPSRTFARSLPQKIYYQKQELRKHVEALKIIQAPLSKRINISREDQNQLVAVSRGVLAMLERETDPSSYADEQAVEFFDMGKGVTIALYPMISERRLPFDAYIGYMAFRNRLPIAYGGGWIFQQRCKIGINVLTAFRGGDSSSLFVQVLRLYQQHYQVKRFIIEPYQIGHQNKEGLKSGAFWFYYRMGFLPLKKVLKELALKEYDKILSDKSYRTPIELLKKLAVSEMDLIINESGEQGFDVLEISLAISKMINEKFGGDRTVALRHSRSFAEKFLGLKSRDSDSVVFENSFQNFALLLELLQPFLNNWTKTEKYNLISIIDQKSNGNERKYVLLFQKHHKLNQAIATFFLNRIYDKPR